MPVLREKALDAETAARVAHYVPPPTLRAVHAALAREARPLGAVSIEADFEAGGAEASWLAPPIARQTDWARYCDPVLDAAEQTAAQTLAATLSSITRRRVKALTDDQHLESANTADEESTQYVSQYDQPDDTACTEEHSWEEEQKHLSVPVAGRQPGDGAHNDAWIRAECARLQHEVHTGCTWRWRPSGWTRLREAPRVPDGECGPEANPEEVREPMEQALTNAALELARNPWYHPRIKRAIFLRIRSVLKKAGLGLQADAEAS